PRGFPAAAPRDAAGRGTHAAPRSARRGCAPDRTVRRRLMAQYFDIHPTHPQKRLVRKAADLVRAGGLIAYPTDSCYALGCDRAASGALERLRRIRGFDERHRLTLMCRDLAEMARYAVIDDAQFRLLKGVTPGS